MQSLLYSFSVFYIFYDCSRDFVFFYSLFEGFFYSTYLLGLGGEVL